MLARTTGTACRIVPRKAALIGDDKTRCTGGLTNSVEVCQAAHMVRIPNADHYVYLSNESQVVRAMNGFLATIP